MPTGHCFYAASTVFATAHSRYARCRRAICLIPAGAYFVERATEDF
ncbi:hypothetical protein HMPREF0573_10572 [Mobiluncus curtisii ATCC 43063]|uniref:Uncharacterized protein n=1 Tax=Mobiluncus curtisii (strain ATCC 43063 / DSM 2711 / V125) TaxID=548479 RepID=D6ZJJ2_MOBCV|nr:hypothetical protein HMPREF0573_10572 [Mobiluncus curtisii ATCC 43063]